MSWEQIDRRAVTTRKDHTCVWCPDKIMSGTRYELDVGLCKGDFQENKYHLECRDAADRFCRDNPGECFDPGSFKRGTTEEA